MADNPEGEESSPGAAQPPAETPHSPTVTTDSPPIPATAAEPETAAAEPPPAEHEQREPEAAPQETPKEQHKEHKKPELTIEKIKPKHVGKEGQDEDVVGMLQGFFGEGITTEEKTIKPVRRPKLMYYNTYRLESRKPFSSEKVTNVMKKCMEEMLDKAKYRSATASDICLQVAEKIRGRVLAMKFDRYKIVVHVTFGPLNRQGEHIGFRGFWDGKRDTYAFHTFRNARIYCNAIVIGVYFE